MWYNTSTGYLSSGDRYTSGKSRRVRNAKDLAPEEVERPQKKQRTVRDMLSASPLKKEYDKSIESTMINAEEEIKEVTLPKTSTSFGAIPDTTQHQSVLPIPQFGDSMSELLFKLTAIDDIVRAGKSIAEATAFLAAPIQDRKAEEIALSQMRSQEHDAWTTFNDGLWPLPQFDWENNKLPPPSSAKPLKTARRRAEALNRLYRTDRAHEGHIVWITNNNIVLLHLVQAMARIIGVEKDLVGGRGGWSATQLADLQSINRILSISGQICQESKLSVLCSKISEI